MNTNEHLRADLETIEHYEIVADELFHMMESIFEYGMSEKWERALPADMAKFGNETIKAMTAIARNGGNADALSRLQTLIIEVYRDSRDGRLDDRGTFWTDKVDPAFLCAKTGVIGLKERMVEQLRQASGTAQGPDGWWEVTKVAVVLRIDAGTISRKVTSGEIRSNGKKGRDRRIPVLGLLEWLTEQDMRDEIRDVLDNVSIRLRADFIDWLERQAKYKDIKEMADQLPTKSRNQ